MTEATGVEAKTIHRLLEVDPKGGGFKRNADNCLDCDLLVVDEASMVDVTLMQALVKAIPKKIAMKASTGNPSRNSRDRPSCLRMPPDGLRIRSAAPPSSTASSSSTIAIMEGTISCEIPLATR
jgi:AAA domain